jgi:hypothetical protein
VCSSDLNASRYKEWWSRRLVATVDDETLLTMDKELALRGSMETTLLLQYGAVGYEVRLLRSAARWCALVVGLPWFALSTLVSVLVLTLLSPTLREAAVTLHNLQSHRPYAIGACTVFLVACGGTLYGVYGNADERLLSQLCVLVSTQAVILGRSIKRWNLLDMF